tara:strand:- start:408 stop:1040 length:633 start_codon:yes stop_codon:yes gene_type:complete
MIFKEIPGVDVLKWISKRFQGDKTIITASNKLNCYKLHTCNESYYLKSNDETKDMKGNIFSWVDMRKWQYIAAFENDTMIGAQAYVIVPTIGRMWDGFIHAESKEISIALNKELFHRTKDQWKINYSEVTIPGGEESGLTLEDFETELNYKCWSHSYVPDMYKYYRVNELTNPTPPPNMFMRGNFEKKLTCRRNFLKRFPDSFDEGGHKE